MRFWTRIRDLFIKPMRGGLILSLILVLWDVVLSGSYVLSWMVCPIWFLVALIRAGFGRASREEKSVRILTPVVTFILVVVNANVQFMIAEANAARIIQACNRYHEANGAYPKKLDDLVPSYMSSIPLAKYCLMFNDFWYFSGKSSSILEWAEVPPFGRPVYDFERGTWGYVD